MTDQQTIVVGITGGIAAYKAVGVIRSFVLLGHRVQVVATEASLRFVGRPTLEAISRNPVHTDLYEGVAEVRHVAIGQSADLIVIAPATANTLAKLAAGLADDLLGNTVLASTAPVVVAPAMHTEMWNNPATVANVELLRSRGVTIVGPASGALTGADVGAGRMEEPAVIVQTALDRLAQGDAHRGSDRSESHPVATGDLTGRSILITAGGTREPLDPVRYIGNRSSGKQGVALAQAARARGAQVTLIAANLEVEPPAGVTVRTVTTTAELLDAVLSERRSADTVVMAAAVADYRPRDVQTVKIKKETAGHYVTLDLEQNPDILAGISRDNPTNQVIIGFAAETADDDTLLEIAREKLRRKGCDYLVVNRVGATEGFGTDRNTVTVLERGGDIVFKASADKLSVAHRILDVLI